MTGDPQDIFVRMKRAMPPWFVGNSVEDDNPIIDALLTGIAYGYAFFYTLYSYALLQVRIATATDGWLDLISSDFFGTNLPRKGQSDSVFRAQIIYNIFRERATRKAVHDVLTQITGREPIIVEPTLPIDTGAYGVCYGYGMGGAYGSLLLPYQAFVTAFRPQINGAAGMNGWGGYLGGYGVGSEVYAHHDDLFGIRDADIYAAIESVKPLGTKIWVAISN